MIGEQFTLTLVRAVFPISAFKDGLDDEWSALVRLGIVTETGTKSAMVLSEQEIIASGSPLSEAVYGFSHGWMLETLRCFCFKRRLFFSSKDLLTPFFFNVENACL